MATTSPFTGGSAELGDGYIASVTGTITYRDPVVPDSAIPAHLKGGPAPADPLWDVWF